VLSGSVATSAGSAHDAASRVDVGASCPTQDGFSRPEAGETTALDASAGVVGSYPCTLDVTGAVQVRGTIWRYPDGDSEVILCDSSSNRPVVDDPMDSEPRLAADKWVDSSVTIPVGCPRATSWRHAVNVAGVVIAHGIERSLCPWIYLDDRLSSLLRAGRRARTVMRRLARANSMRYMTTLTVPTSGPRSREDCGALLRGFLRTEAGRRFFRFGWIAVLEPHKQGGYHLHILHSNRLPAVLVRNQWTRFMLDHRGYTLPSSTTFVRTHEKDWGTSRRAASYGCKYIAKSFGTGGDERGFGQHRYLRSQGLVECGVPLEFLSWEAATEWVKGHTKPRMLSSFELPEYAPVTWLWAAWDGG